MLLKRNCFFIALLLSFWGNAQTKLYTEQYRPQFHFSPTTNWCNDPNGLVYHKGLYHLFYQHNPFGNVWGHMTWGHATSKDLIHWKHLPIAIPEEKDTMIFSGTCVVDKNNTSGFGEAGQTPMVAVYTGHIEGVNQSQHIAYSLDDGITWTKYNKNPVLDLHKKDFRDPKIFWHQQKKYWVMAVMLPIEHMVQFYASPNLKEWKHLSNFGPAGDTSGVWECPDLTQVPVLGKPSQQKWLLQMSQNASMQYFVGEFDGVNFTNENPTDKIYRPDYGPDYYAAITYNQLPQKHLPVAIGWVNNWYYANDIPTTPWKGAMSIPRTLSVKKINGEWILMQKPIEALVNLRNKKVALKDEKLTGKKIISPAGTQFELTLTLSPALNTVNGIKIGDGENNYFEIGYSRANKTFYIDRSKAGNNSFNENYKKMSRYEKNVALQNGQLELRIFYDHSIITVFVNNGEAVFTAQAFPTSNTNEISIFSDGGLTAFSKMTYWQIQSTRK